MSYKIYPIQVVSDDLIVGLEITLEQAVDEVMKNALIVTNNPVDDLFKNRSTTIVLYKGSVVVPTSTEQLIYIMRNRQLFVELSIRKLEIGFLRRLVNSLEATNEVIVS